MMKSTLIIRLGIFALLIAIIVALRVTGVTDFITLEYVRSHNLFLTNYIAQHYFFSVLLYILFFTTLVTFSIPLTLVLTISSGYFYGVFLGAIYSTIGATIGSLFSFLAVRYLIGDYIRHRYEKAYQLFNDRFKAHGISYLLSLHFFPVTPFFVMNALAGLSSIPLVSFVMATALGVLPGSFVYAFAGRQLNYITTPSDLWSVPMMLALGALALLSILPLIARKVMALVTK
jgi:uncharacterized membrane protein YdjX (TVP38/TMEM64 family)